MMHSYVHDLSAMIKFKEPIVMQNLFNLKLIENTDWPDDRMIAAMIFNVFYVSNVP